KFLQVYDVALFSHVQSRVESFVEEIEFDIPGHKALTEGEAAARKESAFKALRKRSPGLSPTADPKKEIPTFARDKEHDFLQEQPVLLTVLETDTVDAEAKPLSNDDLITQLGRPAWASNGLAAMSATWKTKEDRWAFEVVSTKEHAPPPLGIWMQI